jgi:hypothetical protein
VLSFYDASELLLQIIAQHPDIPTPNQTTRSATSPCYAVLPIYYTVSSALACYDTRCSITCRDLGICKGIKAWPPACRQAMQAEALSNQDQVPRLRIGLTLPRLPQRSKKFHNRSQHNCTAMLLPECQHRIRTEQKLGFLPAFGNTAAIGIQLAYRKMCLHGRTERATATTIG